MNPTRSVGLPVTRRATSLMLGIVFGGLVLGSSVACKPGAGKGGLEAALIRPVEKGDLLEEVVESGRIAPAYEVDIKPRVSGEVIEVLVEEGGQVTKGQLLLRLDPVDYKRQLRNAEVDVEEARLNLDNASTELARSQQALDARGISQSEYDLAVRQVELTKVRLKRAEVGLETARDQLGYTSVYAPMDGTVIYRNVDPGELITAGLSATVNGEPVLTIARIDRLLMELDLNQVDVAKVQVGQKARILLDAYPGTEVEGTVTGIAAASHVDTAKGIDVFEVRVELDPSGAGVQIKPGMTAEVRILIGSWTGVLKVPSETVFTEENTSYVYRVVDDPEKPGEKKKEKTEVQVGQRGSREIEIKSGVEEGQQIYAQAEVKDLSIKPRD